MLIHELEKESGLSRATIRYYEKEGFLKPTRLENGYRIYSQEDLDQLMKIQLLRELGMSLDTIRQLQKGDEDLCQAVSEQMQILEKLSKTAQRAKRICTQLYENKTTYAALDAAFYLHEWNKPALPETSGERETVIPTTNNPVSSCEYHPVRRFLARLADYQIWCILIRFLLSVVFKIRPLGTAVNGMIDLAIPFLLIPVEAYMLSKWGTTLGKWLFGLSVWDKNGYTLSFEEARNRTWRVLKEGCGFSIPIYRIYRLYKSYIQYGYAEMDWDRNAEYEYYFWKGRRKLTVAVTAVILGVLSVTTVLCSFSPIHRGELSISQFADNYNFYVDALKDESNIWNTLKEDGSFHDYSSNVINIGNPEQKNFEYSTKNGNITSVAYHREYTDSFVVSTQPEECILAAVTMVMSQQGSHAMDLIALLKQMENADFAGSGCVRYEDIEIKWEIELSNYEATGDAWIKREQAENAWVKMHYWISVLNE